MTMVFGWGQVAPDRHGNKSLIPFPKRDARCAYAFCLIASILSIFILAYVTSFKHFQFGKRAFPDSKHTVPNGSGPVNTIQIVGLVNKNGDHIRLDSIMGYSPKGVLELRWTKNGTDAKTVTSPSVLNISANDTGEARLDCAGVNMTSEILSMVPYKFLPNFKNPCWYEPLIKPDVYDNNRYRGFSRFARNVFKELKVEWNKRLEETPEPKRLRCLPYFFIAGQPKCGSTDFYIKLTSHPDVIAPPMKEPHWWAKNRFGWRMNFSAPVKIQQYIDLFDKAALFMEHVNDPKSSEEEEGYHQLITGDSSVSTLWFNDYWWHLNENCGNSEPKFTNAHYIRYLLPHSRIIVILRNPVERLYSDYLYFRKHGKSPDDFHKEVYLAINTFNRCLNTSTMRACIYNRTIANLSKVRLRIGIYYVFIQEWLRLFPRQQLLVFRLEDYAQDPLDILKAAFKFLDLRSLTSDEEDLIFRQPKIANARRKKDQDLGVMRDDTRDMLDNFYRPYNQKLSILLHDTQYLWSKT